MSTTTMVLYCDSVVTENGLQGSTTIYIKDGIITEMYAGVKEIPHHPILRSSLVIPGFVDIHNHGLGGANDLAEYWLNPEYSQKRLAELGTTSILASVVFPPDNTVTEQIIEKLRSCVGVTTQGAVIEGIHAEGPVIADLGALPNSSTMDIPTFKKFVDWLMSRVPVLMMTISPSIDAQDNFSYGFIHL